MLCIVVFTACAWCEWHLLASLDCMRWSKTFSCSVDAATMPGISQPFPNIFDPLNLLGNTGASNTKIRYNPIFVEHCYSWNRPPRGFARAGGVSPYCLGVASHGFPAILNVFAGN